MGCSFSIPQETKPNHVAHLNINSLFMLESHLCKIFNSHSLPFTS